MSVSKRLRMEILRRDNFTCRYCGASAPDVKLTIDHVTPLTLGGTDDPGNLVAACVDCNAGKSSVQPDAPLVANVEQDALRWSAALKEAALAEAAALEAAWEEERRFIELWCRWFSDFRGNPRGLPADFHVSVRQFQAAGATWMTFADALEVAANSGAYDSWKYFCGVMWKKIAALQEAARAILAAEGDDV